MISYHSVYTVYVGLHAAHIHIHMHAIVYNKSVYSGSSTCVCIHFTHGVCLDLCLHQLSLSLEKVFGRVTLFSPKLALSTTSEGPAVQKRKVSQAPVHVLISSKRSYTPVCIVSCLIHTVCTYI